MDKNNYGKLINNKLRIGIPSVYRLPDGRTISNYDLQKEAVWIKDGFMPIKKVYPILMVNKEYSGFVAVENKGEIVITYKVVDIKEPEDKITIRELQIQIDAINKKLTDNGL